MEIIGYILDGHGTSMFHVSCYNLHIVKQAMYSSNNLTISFFVKHEDEHYTIDARELALKHKINLSGDWNELATSMTKGMLLGCATKVKRPGCMWVPEEGTNAIKGIAVPDELDIMRVTQIRTYPLDKYDEVEVSYSDLSTPQLRDVKQFRFRLNDLFFKKRDGKGLLNFDNVIPVVNGTCFYPDRYGEELVAVGSKEYLPNTTHDTNILLLDFSPVGNIKTIPLSGCTVHHKNENQMFFTLPDTVDVVSKSFILVLGGRMYFQPEFNRIGERVFHARPKDFPLVETEITDKLKTKQYDNQGCYVTANVMDYLDSITDAQCKTAFLIIIDTPKLFVNTETIGKFTNESRILPNESDELKGLFRRKSTKEMVDYVRVWKRSNTMLMIADSENAVHIGDGEGMLNLSSVDQPIGENLLNSDYEFLIIGKEGI